MSQQIPHQGTPDAVDARGGRIAGIDVARALAVFGMFTVHLGVGAIGVFGGDPFGESASETVHQLARGRSSALFAFLAGVSLSLMTGRTVPLEGTALQRARARILVRALVLALLGIMLDLTGAPIAVILTYYGGFFLLALPLLRLRALALGAIAAAVAVLGPVVSFLLRAGPVEPSPRVSSIGGVTDFLLTGYYPAATFMAFVAAGMALGRLDLFAVRVRLTMAATGAGLALAGYGGSWLLLYPLGGLDRLVRDRLGGATDSVGADTLVSGQMRSVVSGELNDLHGQVPTDSLWYLVVATPHSGTGFEIAGAVGTALLVLVACMAAADVAAAPLYPLAAAGSMALTIYTGHILVIAALGFSFQDDAPFRLGAFVLGALVFATLWRLTLGRGPLERALGSAGDVVAELVTATGPPLEGGGGAPPPGSGR
ncbi:heparan-alpha-glucosaminide N-acetyltransferase domain-containing protein [Streptomonospora litoralis]|uniref:heparan-alpha-glucosaminide N-acetyltransferase domain-containing protein n=1 Tax=Streptomonospora litoralis TaxID=2498135 RepID=UPI001F61673A|nr:heparan-alpha-glucosaminide N-acetyltransferase domain-containing protein [Streptomonospora litoralis]